MKILEAPVVDPNAKLADVLPDILRSKCRCAIVVKASEVKGYISLMNIVRRVVIEWSRGVDPHLVLEKLKVGNIHAHPAPIVSAESDTKHVLMDMLIHDSDIALIKQGDAYRVNTLVELAYEMRRHLYGVTVEATVASQSWWAVQPSKRVREAVIHLSMLPTWRLVVIAPDNSIVGVFSATDFFRIVLEGSRPYDKPLQDFLPESTPIVADTDQSLVDTIYIMKQYNIQLMPVVEGLTGFKGVVLAHDIARLAAIRAMGGME